MEPALARGQLALELLNLSGQYSIHVLVASRLAAGQASLATECDQMHLGAAELRQPPAPVAARLAGGQASLATECDQMHLGVAELRQPPAPVAARLCQAPVASRESLVHATAPITMSGL